MIGALFRRGLAFAALWWVLAEGRADTWGVGAAAIAAAAAASLLLLPPGRSRFSPAGAAAFAGFFLSRSLQGGLQVARQALRPRPDLAPALLELPLALPPGPATVLLAYTLNLLPGTLSVEIAHPTLRLHVLDARLDIAGEVREAESHIARMLGISEVAT